MSLKNVRCKIHVMPQRIFILDDEPDIVKMATVFLQEHGYMVTSDTRPKSALEKIQSNPPDLLLLDIRMPDLDGFEVCEIIKGTPRLTNLPIIILSVHAKEADVVLGLELGADDYIRKPFREREFLARIK